MCIIVYDDYDPTQLASMGMYFQWAKDCENTLS